MTNPNDSAFTWTQTDNGTPSVTGLGLSKREYFAAMAMQGNLSNPEAMQYLSNQFGKDNVNDALEAICSKSVYLADALITALNAGNTYNKTQLLPSELLEQRNELLECLKKFHDKETKKVWVEFAAHIPKHIRTEIESLISKIEK